MCVPADRHPYLNRLTERVLQGNSISQYEGACLRKNGQRFPVSVTACPVRGSGGEVAAVSAILRDISERYEAQETSALLASIVEFSQDAIHSVKLDGTIVSWNQDAEALFGYSREEIVGKSAAILAFPGREGEADRFLEAIRKGGAVTSFQTILQQKNGCGKDVLLSISPIRNPAGEVVGASGIAHDITKQVLAEHRLRESEERFREMFECAPNGILVSGLDGHILQANAPFCRMLDYSEEEVLAKSWTELTHPDDLQRCVQLKTELAQNPKASAGAEKRYLRRDGSAVWARIKISLVRDSDGNATYYLVHVEDITERKRSDEALRASEERFRQLAENIRDVFFVCETDPPKVIYLSPAYEDIWGRPCQEVYDRPEAWLDAIHQDDRKAAGAMFVQSLRGTHFDSEHRIVRPDGSVRWIRIQTFPVFNDQRALHRVVGTAEDITVRRQLEKELNHARKLQAVGGLAAGIAHEINTPIQFVSDNVRFLQDSFRELQALIQECQEVVAAGVAQDIDPRLLEGLKRVAESADLNYLRQEIPKALGHSLDGLAQVGGIVKAMREFAHPGRTEKVAVDLNRAITNTLLVARNELKYVADVETEFGDLPPVFCHAGDMNQVFLNLLVNAAHAIKEVTREGDPKGKIRVQTTCEGETVRIAISDTGCGVPEQIRERIFDPFFTTKEIGKGTGQGLSIARSIVVDKHRGTLTFESKVGEGTTFLICLPVSGS